MNNIYYHVSKSPKLTPTVGREGFNVCKSLNIIKDRIDITGNDVPYIYEVQVVDNLKPLIFDCDLMQWDAKSLAIALLCKHQNKDFPGFEGEITPDKIHFEGKLSNTDYSLLVKVANLKNGASSSPELILVYTILKKFGYDYIQYVNEGEGTGTELSYIFLPNQIKSCELTSLQQLERKSITESILKEDNRVSQINQSRGKGPYKDQSQGKNRFERKRLSHVANTVSQYNKIDMNKLFKQDSLEVVVPVIGETDTYNVTVRMDGVIAEIRKEIKNNHNKLEYKVVVKAVTKVFNVTDVYTKCTCDDFKYNFAHWNIIKNVSVDDTAHDPGPGKGIRNPNDDKGRGCKHILLVLANGDWMLKVASVINNYIHYAEEKIRKAFIKLIFPKIYGVTIDEASSAGLIDEETDLASTPDIIDAINEYGKNRGKMVKGSNINPVYADELSKKQKAEKEKAKEEPKKEPKKEPEKPIKKEPEKKEAPKKEEPKNIEKKPDNKEQNKKPEEKDKEPTEKIKPEKEIKKDKVEKPEEDTNK